MRERFKFSENHVLHASNKRKRSASGASNAAATDMDSLSRESERTVAGSRDAHVGTSLIMVGLQEHPTQEVLHVGVETYFRNIRPPTGQAAERWKYKLKNSWRKDTYFNICRHLGNCSVTLFLHVLLEQLLQHVRRASCPVAVQGIADTFPFMPPRRGRAGL